MRSRAHDKLAVVWEGFRSCAAYEQFWTFLMSTYMNVARFISQRSASIEAKNIERMAEMTNDRTAIPRTWGYGRGTSNESGALLPE